MAAPEDDPGQEGIPIRYRSRDFIMSKGVADNVILTDVIGRSRVVSAADAQLLSSCGTFRTIADHAIGILRRGHGAGDPLGRGSTRAHTGEAALVAKERSSGKNGDTAPVETELERLIVNQLLIPEDVLREQLIALARSGDHSAHIRPTVTTLAIPTCNRPKMLARCLATYVENIRIGGRSIRLLVADDGADSSSTKRAVSSVHAELHSGLELLVLDRQERVNLAEQLAPVAGVPLEIVRFAILGDDRCGFTVGSNRNAILLATIGELSIQVDDDTTCRLNEPPDKHPGTAIMSRVDPLQSWFATQGAPEVGGPIDGDFIAIHERLLGATLLRQIENSNALDVTDLRDSLLSVAARGQSELVTTHCGSTGDSGMEEPWGRFAVRGDSLARLIETETGMQRGLTARDVTRSSTTETITDARYCMGMNIGIDQRSLVPPFFPVLRAEDATFITVLRICRPGSLTGILPFTIEHRPSARAPLYDLSLAGLVSATRTNDMVMMLLASYRWPRGGTPEDNIRNLGAFVRRLGDQPVSGLTAAMRDAFVRSRSSFASDLEMRLGELEACPVWWRHESQRFIHALRESMTDPTAFVPSDLPGNPRARVELFARMLRCYGDLLIHWPAILAAARDVVQLAPPASTALSR